MRKSIVILSFLALFGSLALLAQAQTANVAGDWELTAQTQRGPMNWSVNFVQDGEKLAVTMVGPRGETKGEGTIKGNEIQWSVTRTSPQGDKITITYKGKVEGATMSGQSERGGGGTTEWTAKKK
jgi:hypothetical protein